MFYTLELLRPPSFYLSQARFFAPALYVLVSERGFIRLGSLVHVLDARGMELFFLSKWHVVVPFSFIVVR